VGQWLYDRRDPVSWCFALGMALPLVWLGLKGVQTAPQTLQEMVAMLEVPPPPAAPVVPARPQPPQVQRQLSPMPVQSVPQAQERTAPEPVPAAATPAAHVPAPAPAFVAPVPSTPPEPRPQAARSAAYEAQLLAYLERIKRYPTSREARLSKPQGTVRLWLLLSRQGELLEAGVVASSGSNLLDGEALRTVRAGQFPAFPEEAFAGQDRHRFTVNLKYQIEG